MVCWEAAPGFVSWALEDLVIKKKRDDHDAELKSEQHSSDVCVCFQTWSLTLCDFELLLQRDQLESEELRHLLVLLSLPEFETQSHSQPLEHT